MPGLHFAFAGRRYVKLYQQGAGERLWGCRREKRLAAWFASGQGGCFGRSPGLHWQIFPALLDPASLYPRRTPDQSYWGESPQSSWGSSTKGGLFPEVQVLAPQAFLQASVVQSLSPVWLFVTPWTAAHQASRSFTTLPELAQIHVHRVSDTVQPSHPQSPPSPPALNLSQHQGLFQEVSSSHQVAKWLEIQLQHQSF